MKIAARIPASSEKALRRILWTGQALEVVDSPESLVALVHRGGCELIVLDPTGIREEVFSDTLAAIVDSGVSLAIWARSGATTCARILEASVFVPTIVLLRGVNDDAVGLRATVHSDRSTTATAMILHRVARHVLLLP